ncbi:uncharacterized protein At3g49055 [Ziziphus jujuba]|uniref:Uncharacterized protein At3g49055 n=2 Tax=Ziziphus jujuba TaxID=326968 RepID=A0A6P6G404_ZIZJJ|nr:uncharacterized protein At3g49055 [Ziziphus jujuba]
MENTSEETPTEIHINGPDSPSPTEFSEHHDLHAELDSLRYSHQSLLSTSAAMEESLNLLQQERDKAVINNADLVKAIGEITSERDTLSERIRVLEASLREKEDGFAIRIEQEENQKEKLKKEAELYRERIESLESARKKSNGFLLKLSESLRLAEERLVRIIDNVVEEEKVENCAKESDGLGVELESDEELKSVSEELMAVTKLAGVAELKVNEYKESRKKEKREFENSVVSLTEENRDINSLLRIALVEKEAVEKRLKGNSEQKRVAILQIAERGLQRVGFGFMKGSGSAENSSESSGTKVDSSGASAGSKSDGSECEEEVVSLASTVERIMKKLRLEITQLRRSLEESRSDTERLQSLTEKQAQDIAENMLYIKELEDRERVLAQNVEELLMEVKEAEAEVARWREACELEVEAGKHEIEERNKVVSILTQELEKTKTALDISNRKLNLKEELAAAAMAAQAAAEKSLQLADNTAAGLRERVEELSKQLEEAESQDRNRHKIRHLCWPWRALKLSTATTYNRAKNVRRMLPEMQALLR